MGKPRLVAMVEDTARDETLGSGLQVGNAWP